MAQVQQVLYVSMLTLQPQRNQLKALFAVSLPVLNVCACLFDHPSTQCPVSEPVSPA